MNIITINKHISSKYSPRNFFLAIFCSSIGQVKASIPRTNEQKKKKKSSNRKNLEENRVNTLGGMGSCDVFWYPWDGGMMTLRIPPTFIDFTAASIPEITCIDLICQHKELSTCSINQKR